MGMYEHILGLWLWLEERWRSVSVGNRFRGSKEVSNLGGVPGGSSGSGGDTPSGQTICDGLEGHGSGGLNLSDHWNQ